MRVTPAMAMDELALIKDNLVMVEQGLEFLKTGNSKTVCKDAYFSLSGKNPKIALHTPIAVEQAMSSFCFSDVPQHVQVTVVDSLMQYGHIFCTRNFTKINIDPLYLPCTKCGF
jgi:hypothetical protein